MISKAASVGAAFLVVFSAASCGGDGSKASNPPAGPPAPPPLPVPALPATPDGFQVIRLPGGAVLAWQPVSGATAYSVLVQQVSTGATQAFETANTSIAVGYADAVGDLDFNVTAVTASRSSLPTASIRAPQQLPSLTVALDGREAVVAWTADPALGNDALIGRGTTSQNISAIGDSATGSYRDSQIREETNYVYQVALRHPPLTVLSATANVVVKLFPPGGITVAYGCCGSLQLDWQPVAGATAYQIRQSSEAGVPGGFALDMPSPPSFSLDCFGAADCFFTVATIDQTGAVGNPSAPVHAFIPPDIPFATAQSRIGAVAIGIGGSPARADHFVVSRADQQSGPFVDIGVTTAREFVDASVPTWTRRWYRVTAVSPGGTSLQPSFPVSGFATEPPDQVNLASADAFLVSQQNGQSFTVGSPGQLMGIEVEVPPLAGGPSTIALWSAGRLLGLVDGIIPESQPGRALVLDMVTGVYFDLSALAMQVSSGQQLRFQFVGGGFLDANHDSYPRGTAFIAGSPDNANDLVFKSFVKAATALPSPDPLAATGGAGAIRLDWQASPGAISYRVLRSDVPGLPPAVEVGATDQTWFLDTGLAPGSTHTYVVEALDGTSSSAASSPATATVRPLLVDQENVGDGPGPREAFPCAPASVGQSFTAGRSGQLVGIEVAKAIGGDYQVEVIDVASNTSFGTVLAGATTGPFFCPAMPLVPGVVGDGFVDLSSLGITVSAGQILRLRLTATASTACLCLLDAPGGYAGGSEEAGDQAVPDRDLAFRTFVQ